MKVIRTLTTLALIGAISYAIVRPRGGPSVGSQAVLIDATQLNGKAFRLAEHRGRVVVLDFWATWCRPCRKTLPALQKLHEMYAGDDSVVVASVNVDESRLKSRVQTFMKRNRFDFEVILDGTSRWSRAFGIRTIPYLLIIDGKGRIHARIQHVAGRDLNSIVDLLKNHIEDAQRDANQ